MQKKAKKECLVCQLNKSDKFRIKEGKYWLVDKSFDIKLKGLRFLKTKRHIESVAGMNKFEENELGHLLKEAALGCQKDAKSKRVIAMSLGLKDPHLHFWVVPVTNENETEILGISRAVKVLADKYR